MSLFTLASSFGIHTGNSLFLLVEIVAVGLICVLLQRGNGYGVTGNSRGVVHHAILEVPDIHVVVLWHVQQVGEHTEPGRLVGLPIGTISTMLLLIDLAQIESGDGSDCDEGDVLLVHEVV